MQKSELEAIIEETDLFKVLGLEFTASPDEVRHAYKHLAKQVHPDMFPDADIKALAEQAFIRISEAFNTLRDPFKRKDYERTLDRVVEAERKAREAKQAQQAAKPPAAASTQAGGATAPPSTGASQDEKIRQVRREQAENHFTQGKQYERKNQLDDAIREYQEAIRLCNEVAKYHSQLGFALQKKNWTGYAQAEFKVALHFDPTDKLALKNYQPSAGLSIPRNSLGFKLLNLFKGSGQSNRIGDILIQQGHLKKEQLQQALKKQADEKLLLGELLIRMKFIKPEHLAQALIHQGEDLAKEAAEQKKQ